MSYSSHQANYIQDEVCSVSLCDRTSYAKTFCHLHYIRNLVHGSPYIAKHKYHGLRETKEYSVWKNMKNRCLNKSEKAYKNYGGRGITIAPEWVNDFEAFYSYVGQRPTPKHTIERIDNNKGYQPGNVKWATRQEQARNKRVYSNNKTGVSGVRWVTRDKKFVVYYGNKFLGTFKELSKATARRKEYEDALQ